MSRTVDERVVQMQFDNEDFERRVKSTMSVLDKLKAALHLDGASKGLEEVGKAANSFSMGGMNEAINQTAGKFSVLEVAAITAISNITNSVVNAGTRMLREFTLAPISDGFSEYELKMGSVQTIMAGTGEEIDVVNGYLNDLNAYSDKTIYSFSDMTSNIGKFTNAGVKLGDAVSAIQGVANVAAISGANANEASRAMYNFSQALSVGEVKLMDWRSIENANMGTIDFKQNLIDTAVALGTLEEAEDGVYKTMSGNEVTATNFNEALKDGWLNSQVLTETLTNYSSDVREMTKEEKANYMERLKGIGYTDEQIDKIIELGQKATDAATEVKTFSQLIDTVKEAIGSGWAETFEIIFGDFEEAKALWTRVNNVIDPLIGKFSKIRNNFLYQWDEAGGRTATIETIANLFKAIASIVQPISKALGEVFKPLNGGGLAAIAKGLEFITSKLIIGEKVSKGIHAVAKAIFTVLGAPLKLASMLIGGVVKLVQKLYSEGVKLGEKLQPVFEKILYYIDEVVETFQAGFEKSGLGESFQKIGESFTKVFGKVKEIFNDIFGGILGGFSPSADELIKKVQEIAASIEGFVEKHIWPAFNNLATIIEQGSNSMVEFFDSIDIDKEAIITAVSGALDKLAESVGKFFGAINNKRLSILESIGEKFDKAAGLLNSAKAKIASAVDQIKEKLGFLFEGLELKDIENAINSGILTAFVIAIAQALRKLSKLFEKLSKTTATLDELLGSIADSLTNFSESIKNRVKVDMVKAIATAILILVGSLAVLSLIPQDKLINSVGVMVAIMMSLSVLSKVLTDAVRDIDANDYLKFAGSVAILSAAIFIIAMALKKIASSDSENLGSAFVILTIIIAEMVMISKQLNGMNTSSVDAKVFTAFAASIYMIARAIAKLGKMDADQLIQGGIAVSLIMAALAGIAIGMSFAFKKLEIVAGFDSTSVVATLVGLAVALNLMIPVLAAIAILNNLPGGSGVGELIILAGGLAAVAAALGYITDKVGGSKMAAGAASLIIMAAALNMLIPPLLVMAAMPFEVLVKGVRNMAIVIGALLAVMVVAGGLSTLVSKGLIALGKAFLYTGIGVTALSIGLTLLGPALVSVAAGVVAFAAIMETAKELIANFVSMLLQGISLGIQRSAEALVNGFGVIILAIARALDRYGGEVIGALVGFLIKTLDELTNRIPLLIEFVINAMNTLSLTMRIYAVPLKDSFVNLFYSFGVAVTEAFLQPLSTLLGEIPIFGDQISGALDGTMAKWDETADALALKAQQSMQEANEKMQAEKDTLTQTTGDIGQSMVDSMESSTSGTGGSIGDNFIGNIVGSLAGGTGDVEKAAGGIGDVLDISSIAGENGKLASSEEIMALVGGLQDGTGSVEDVMDQLQNGMTMNSEEIHEDSYEAASQAPQGVADAINDGAPVVQEAFSSLRMDDMQADFYADGKANVESYSSGITDSKSSAKNAVENVTRSALAGVLRTEKEFKTKGSSAATNYSSGLTSKGTVVSAAGSTVGNKGSSGVSSTEYNYYTSGRYVADGLIRGINSKKQQVYDAGYSLGKTGNKGAAAGAQVKSPSRETMRIGRFIGEGLILGIYKMMSDVGKAGEELGEESVKTVGDTTARMASMLAKDFNGYSPTVTPVLDLSNVNRQMGTLDSMFGSRTIGLAGGINQVYTPNSLLATSLDTKFEGLAKALGDGEATGTNNWYINVDGATNPEDFADRLVRRIKMKTRTAYG